MVAVGGSEGLISSTDEELLDLIQEETQIKDATWGQPRLILILKFRYGLLIIKSLKW
jgi:hypothetical protein